jgi:hypothetical protein
MPFPMLSRLEACASDITLERHPHAVPQLHRRTSELGRDIDPVDVHARPDAFDIDAMMTLKVAQDSMIGDGAHAASVKAETRQSY